jgi:hypothetical protein
MAIPGNVGGKKSTFSSPAAMAQAQRSAESQSMKALQDRREQTRQDFFKGRPDISPNRLDRRQIQADLYEKFKQEQMKPVLTTSGKPTGAFQSIVPGGPTLADRAQELAFKYGPTPREVFGDIGYGLGSIGKGIGDFIGRGGVIGSVLSGLYDKFKSGTQQGIETVGGLYDNLRSAFSGQPTVNYGGGSTMLTTTNESPRVDLTPTSINTETLPSMDLNRNIGDESDPSIFGITNTGVPLPNNTLGNIFLPTQGYDSRGYLPEGFSNVGIENPLFRNVSYEPIRVSDMDMTGVMAKEDSRGVPVLPDNVIPRTPFIYPLPRNVVPMTPVLPPEVTDPRMYPNQILFAKNGGSVDKYAGLGYKLK